jgi:antitoxin VapB
VETRVTVIGAHHHRAPGLVASGTDSDDKHHRFVYISVPFIEDENVMALSLKDPTTDRLAREVAALMGETLTDAVRTSLAERLERERLKRGMPRDLDAEIDRIVQEYAALPVLDDRTPDEILGYDENGLPS